jgi:arylsulfatase A-like enzyme
MRFPGQIPAGSTCDALCGTIDLLPTAARLLGATLPEGRIIDGRDIWPLMTGGPEAKTPHDYFYCYYDHELRAIRDERWKLMLQHQSRTLNGRKPGRDGYPVQYDVEQVGMALYDLDADVGETTNVAQQNQEVVQRLMAAVDAARDDLGDRLTGAKGKNVRPAGTRRQAVEGKQAKSEARRRG